MPRAPARLDPSPSGDPSPSPRAPENPEPSSPSPRSPEPLPARAHPGPEPLPARAHPPREPTTDRAPRQIPPSRAVASENARKPDKYAHAALSAPISRPFMRGSAGFMRAARRARAQRARADLRTTALRARALELAGPGRGRVGCPMSKKLVEPMPLWQEKSQNAIERMRRLQACPAEKAS